MLPNQARNIYSVNVSWLFPELPFRERPAAAAAAGFDTIEFGFPSQVDLEALAAAHAHLGLRIASFNQDVPVWDRANRGTLSNPARRDEFRRTFDQALAIAARLDAEKIMLPAGVELEGLSRAFQRDTIVENLRWAAPLAEQAGVTLTLEVLNPTDNPGYFLTSSRETLEILRAVDHPRVKFQLDTYHLQMLEGGLVPLVCACSGWIGHVQFADYPGRHEPGTGGIDFTALLGALDSAGYHGPIGLEYKPSRPGAETLDWVPAGGRKARP
jgi:hydroxypyruvate isomerase